MAVPRHELPRAGKAFRHGEYRGAHSPQNDRTSRDFVRECRAAGITSCLTEAEQAVLRAADATMADDQRVSTRRAWSRHLRCSRGRSTSRWAFRLYDTQASKGLFARIPSADLRSFVATAKLRSADEIDAAREEAGLWHYRRRLRHMEELGVEVPDNPVRPGVPDHTFAAAIQFATHAAQERGWIVALDGDFPAKGMAYRDVTDAEWHEVTSITVERQRARQSLGPGAHRHGRVTGKSPLLQQPRVHAC